MQAFQRPYARALPTLGVLCLLGLTGLVFSRTLLPAGSMANGVAAASLVLATTAGLLWLGTWALARSLVEALSAMEAGEVLGSWEEPDGTPVDVGARLAIRKGELLPFAARHQSVVEVELQRGASALCVRGVYNNGHGDTAFAHTLLYAPEYEVIARGCGEQLAQFHGVTLREV